MMHHKITQPLLNPPTAESQQDISKKCVIQPLISALSKQREIAEIHFGSYQCLLFLGVGLKGSEGTESWLNGFPISQNDTTLKEVMGFISALLQWHALLDYANRINSSLLLLRTNTSRKWSSIREFDDNVATGSMRITSWGVWWEYSVHQPATSCQFLTPHLLRRRSGEKCFFVHWLHVFLRPAVCALLPGCDPHVQTLHLCGATLGQISSQSINLTTSEAHYLNVVYKSHFHAGGSFAGVHAEGKHVIQVGSHVLDDPFPFNSDTAAIYLWMKNCSDHCRQVCKLHLSGKSDYKKCLLSCFFYWLWMNFIGKLYI